MKQAEKLKSQTSGYSFENNAREAFPAVSLMQLPSSPRYERTLVQIFVYPLLHNVPTYTSTTPRPPFGGPFTHWAMRLFEGLAEEDDLELVIDREHTSTGDTTEDVSTSTLEEGLDALLGDDLLGGVEGALVLDGLTRRHHHATTDGVKRVRGNTGTGGDAPTEDEGGKEVVLESTGQDNGLDRVVHAEVETTVDDDTGDGGHEATVETGNTVRGEGLAVDVNETVELAGTTALGVLVVVRKTGTGVVERVDEEERGSTSSLKNLSARGPHHSLRAGETYTTGGEVASHPPGVAVTLLLEAEHLLELVAESEVQGLGREVTDDVGSVTTPERHQTLIGHGALEAVANAGVLAVETTGLQHLLLLGVVSVVCS